MTPDRLAEINARTKGDPMAMARELTAELNRVEAERNQALSDLASANEQLDHVAERVAELDAKLKAALSALTTAVTVAGKAAR